MSPHSTAPAMPRTIAEPTVASKGPKAYAWLPLLLLPVAAAFFGHGWPGWVRMWALGAAVYIGLKWLTYADSPLAFRVSLGRSLAYLLLWPGMEATRFLDPKNQATPPRSTEWAWGAVNLILGLAMLFVLPPLLVEYSRMVAGWAGMAGLVYVLHFGLFRLLSATWRGLGIDAPMIMRAPLLATSLADFWGRRWNLAFRDAAHAYVFRPLRKPIGAIGAMLAVFLVSGLLHDLVISVPADAGYGWPTLYFAIQALGFLFERSSTGRKLKLGHGLRGWGFTALVTVLPVPLLFHLPFLDNVILPMTRAVHL